MHSLEDGFNITALVLAFAAIVLRSTVTLLRNQPFKKDDILLVACWIPVAVTCIWTAVIMPFHYMAVARGGLFEIFYALSLWLLRMILVQLYERIFHDRDLGLVHNVVFGAYFVFNGILVFGGVNALPHRQGGKPPADSARKLLDILRITHAGANVIISLLLILLPLPWILPIKISHSTSWAKLGLTLLVTFMSFLCAMIRLGFSITTMVHRDYRNRIALWSCLELSFNVMALCVPSRPVDHCFRPDENVTSIRPLLEKIWDAWRSLGMEGPSAHDPESQPLILTRPEPAAPYRPWERTAPQQSGTETAPRDPAPAPAQVAAAPPVEASAAADHQPAAQ